MVKNCVICGELFDDNGIFTKKYCTQKCKDNANVKRCKIYYEINKDDLAIKHKNNYEKKKEEERQKPIKKDKLSFFAEKALQEGLTYVQYVAKYNQ